MKRVSGIGGIVANTKGLVALWVLGWPALGALAAPVEELVRLPSQGGAQLPCLLSWDDEHPPARLAVLFNGGGGAVGLSTRGIPRPGANFLVRSRALFNREGIATAVIDVPSDVPTMSDAYRAGARHLQDVRAVAGLLRQRFPERPLLLVGTSRGTVSAAHAGAALGDEVAGVVLSSSVYNATRGGVGLAGFDFASIRTRLLFVHHVDDACAATPYTMALRASVGGELVSVHGGEAPRSAPCEAFAAHGFLGVEGPTVAAIAHWMRGAPAPKTVP